MKAIVAAFALFSFAAATLVPDIACAQAGAGSTGDHSRKSKEHNGHKKEESTGIVVNTA